MSYLIKSKTHGAYGWSLLGIVVLSLIAAAQNSAATNSAEPNAVPTYSAKKDIVATTFWMKPTPGPFYAALPFNDLAHPEVAKIWVPSAWTAAAATGQQPRSACINRWLKITNKSGVSCYAQWEAFGPGTDDDAEYVFGDKPPNNGKQGGIDLSPGAAKFLGLDDTHQTVSWQFVDESNVPPGPWVPSQ
jgi:hypothetical protein